MVGLAGPTHIALLLVVLLLVSAPSGSPNWAARLVAGCASLTLALGDLGAFGDAWTTRAVGQLGDAPLRSAPGGREAAPGNFAWAWN